MKSMVNAVRIGRYYTGWSPTPEAYLVYEAAAGGAGPESLRRQKELV